MNAMSLISLLLLLAALLVCIIAWAGVPIKDPILVALGLSFLSRIIDRLSGVIYPQPVVVNNRG